ncbi:tRNA (adenosine(37)-N6)-threonylcarbamoyltransferase complex dimerization subunit type 1 TsaB [Ideonella dechloratans]|uniref:tRNA (Adenosine(37)-N6)-threonylcarbamoyltransferase complex dimerization subunit type 1 TsaB n=1 Tax=Ideonella dechloratans TaxID=36863 RepID=A0A643FEI6_IDEDE|nr:tRNA (adenosine(37)-N6)-threonylcarbamoyltransferase complex dimerization subunit type 1 TsaB [Ideonella dechloratans]KAB0583375.1 tRNA (adenosine(37)-N6)-threonylcarbamoyltransferase complex dimerization subunit type 1 TsaB [Ideonella dechloratans]UFU09620.1 tRNA (adenosine(37)-N6)-threonylcarbamoyltransferase complex dimerization subunit type 1 TsaB [Ideonella dechloratans]
MKLLALDTATEQMAVAVGVGESAWTHGSAGGALASATLVPTVLDLLAQAGVGLSDLDAIAFGQGPGAFTGLRTAVSVAQGLAFGAGKPVLPLDSLLIVAEDARAQGALDDAPAEGPEALLWVAMDARMDEVYAAAYRRGAAGWAAVVAPHLSDLDTLRARWGHAPLRLAGNAPAAFGERLPLPAGSRVWGTQQDRAGAALRLAREAWGQGRGVPPEQALPVYLRDKVALTTAEREALKQGAGP